METCVWAPSRPNTIWGRHFRKVSKPLRNLIMLSKEGTQAPRRRGLGILIYWLSLALRKMWRGTSSSSLWSSSLLKASFGSLTWFLLMVGYSDRMMFDWHGKRELRVLFQREYDSQDRSTEWSSKRKKPLKSHSFVAFKSLIVCSIKELVGWMDGALLASEEVR